MNKYMDKTSDRMKEGKKHENLFGRVFIPNGLISLFNGIPTSMGYSMPKPPL